jgi:uncharacterized lipoprotein
MKRMKCFLYCFLIAILITSCAFIPQKVTLAPELDIAGSSIGRGKNVALKVVDERADTCLGRRASGYGPAAEIATDQDVCACVNEQIVEGLRRNEFNPVLYTKDAPRSLIVEIRLIEYTSSAGFATAGIHAKAALKAICRNNELTYEKMYRTESEQRKVFVPTAEENERLINEALSQVINKLFQDQELTSFLAK